MRSPGIRFEIAAALVVAVLLLPASAGAAVALRWDPAIDVLAPGETTTVSVLLDDPLDVRTIDVIIEYDPARLDGLSCAPGALFDTVACYVWREYEETVPGRWHAFAAIIGATCKTTGPGELLRWSARGAAEGWSDLTTVEVTLWDPAANRYADVTLAKGQIEVTTVSAAGPVPAPLTLALAPNPFNPGTTVSWSAPAGASYRLELFDARGRRLALLASGAADGAAHELSWAGRDEDGRPAPSGVYLFRLSSGAGPPLLARGVLLR